MKKHIKREMEDPRADRREQRRSIARNQVFLGDLVEEDVKYDEDGGPDEEEGGDDVGERSGCL